VDAASPLQPKLPSATGLPLRTSLPTASTTAREFCSYNTAVPTKTITAVPRNSSSTSPLGSAEDRLDGKVEAINFSLPRASIFVHKLLAFISNRRTRREVCGMNMANTSRVPEGLLHAWHLIGRSFQQVHIVHVLCVTRNSLTIFSGNDGPLGPSASSQEQLVLNVNSKLIAVRVD